jgi:hypothetical protein
MVAALKLPTSVTVFVRFVTWVSPGRRSAIGRMSAIVNVFGCWPRTSDAANSGDRHPKIFTKDENCGKGYVGGTACAIVN